MAKWLPFLTALSGTAAIACSFGPNADSSAPREESPEPQQRSQATNVPRLYAENCSSCHGDKGEGGGGGTRTFISKEKFDQKYDRIFFDAIKHGVENTGMPDFGDSLSDPEIWGLVVHIREMQRRGLRDAGDMPKAENGVYKSKHHGFTVETIVDSGLGTPWGIDWLPDGRMLVTNRPGYMIVVKGKESSPRVEGMPESIEMGQGGLMDVTVHPDYAKNGWIYLAYTEPAKSGRGGMTKIVRGKLQFQGDTPRWTSQETIFEADQEFYTGAGVHFGSRIVFDGKGHVFFAIGERGGNMLAQQLDSPFGKVYRLTEDGKVPADNPFVKEAAGGKSHVGGIWTLGHRNQQGLVFDLEGRLWVTEHGPRGGDEVNEIVKGANYGWPVVAFSINYNGTTFRTPWPGEGQNFAMPVFRWLPSIGASGLDVAKGAAFPAWKGDLLAGGLSGQNLDRFRISGGKVVEHEELLFGLGRVREVAVGPDGYVYVALNGPDKVIRLVPAK